MYISENNGEGLVLMNVNTKNISDALILKISILIIMIIIVVTMILPLTVKAYTSANDSRSNLFYLEILNYSVPSAKVSTLDPEVMVENSFSLKDSILNAVGVNIKEPNVIMGKEIAFFNNNSIPKINNISINLTSYELASNEVIKTDNNTQSTSANLSPTLVPSTSPAVDNSNPEILIYHTHTDESYLPGKPDNTDQTQSVCAVGDVITNELQNNYSIKAIHDKTEHEEVYNDSYSRSSVTVDKYLKQYGDFKLIIDLHRDSSDGKHAETCTINGESIAQFMFVMAKNNPHYDKNIGVVNKILGISKKLYPGLCRDTFEYDHGMYCFNQTKSNNAVLIEVGNELNTTTESKNTGKYLAKIISEYIKGNN